MEIIIIFIGFLILSLFVGAGTIFFWIFRIFNPKRILCNACGEYTPKNKPRCIHCDVLMNKEKQERLVYIRKVRGELLGFKQKGIIPEEIFSILDKQYAEQENGLINQLRPSAVQPLLIKPAAYKVEEKPFTKEEPKKIETAPVQEEVKTEVVKKIEKRESIVSWQDKVIKSLLYVGVLGLISTVSIILYNQRHAIPDFVKFSILFLITAGIFIGGYLLKFKFDYGRTGLALIVLSSLLLPMNYLSAKVFGLIHAGHTYTEWFGVAFFSAVLYMVLAKLIKDNIFVYLSAVTGLVCAGLLLLAFKLSFVLQSMVIVVLGTLYLITGFIFSKSDNNFYSRPFDYVSRGIICLSIMMFLPNAYVLTSSHSYFTIAVFVSELAAFFMLASLLYKSPELMYLSGICFIGCCINIILSLPSKNCTPSVPLYFVSYLTVGIGYILSLFNKKDYARPFYVSGYSFSFIGLFFLISGFFADYSYFLTGAVIASLFYAASAYYTKEKFNAYLTIAVILGLIAYYVSISSIGIEGVSVIFPITALFMCFSSRLKLPGYIVSPLYISSHIIVPATGIVFNSYFFDIGKCGYLSSGSLIITSIFYGYNSVISKNKVFSYAGIGAVYSAFIAYLYLICGLDINEIMPLFALVTLIGSLTGLLFWKIERELWAWPILNLSLIAALCAVFCFVTEDLVSLDLMYICLFSGIVVILHGIARTLVKNNYMGVFTFMGGWLLNTAYVIFLMEIGVKWGYIGLFLSAPSLIYLAISQICKKSGYLKHFSALYILITSTSLLGLVMSAGISDINAFLWASLISAIIFAIMAMVSKKDILIYLSLAAFILFFISLLETFNIYTQSRGIYVLGLSVVLFVLGRVLKSREIHIHKNPFYVAGFFLTAAVPLSYVITDIDWYINYLNMAIITFFAISLIYGIMAIILKRRALVYLSAIVFGIAYTFILQKFDVGVFNYGIWFLSLGFAIVGIGKVAQPEAKKIEQNPFYIIGLGIAVLVFFSIIVGAQFYLGEEINIAILLTLLSALMYGMLSYFLKEKKMFYLSLLMLMGSYYLVLWKYRIGISEFYTIFPAVISIGWGIREKIKKTAIFNISPLDKINIGLCIYFIPGIYQALAPRAILAGAIVGLSAMALVLMSIRTRVKYTFISGLVIFTGVVLLQAFHFINFGAVPKVVWIGLGSIICIFIGFLGEKRFKEFVKGRIHKTKKSISDYFTDWR